MMPVELAPVLNDVRTGFQGIREIIGAWRDLRIATSAGSIKANDVAELEAKTEAQLALAEAQIAKGLGYPLCTCSFPPTIMLRVGVMDRHVSSKKPVCSPVHECPKCGANDAAPFSFYRTSNLSPKAA